jgi:cobalt-zinc-cadmium efflux system outer membrane protein
MKQFPPFISASAVAALLLFAPALALAQQGLTWDQVKAKFEAANPTLKADAINVEETKAEEITAFLRPNPQVGLYSSLRYPLAATHRRAACAQHQLSARTRA